MTLDSVYFWAQIAVAGFGVIALFTGKMVNDRETEKNARQAKNILALEKSNIDAQSALEKEKVTRLEMEKSLTPRAVTVLSGKDGKSNADPLEEFAGTELIIGFLPEDSEARRAAEYLSFEMKQAGWNVLEVKRNPLADSLNDGVEVKSYSSFSNRPQGITPEEATRRQRDEVRARIAATTLVAFLADEPNNWENVRQSSDVTGTLPPNRLRVLISLKPMRYFSERDMPEWAKSSQEDERAREEKSRKENLQRDRQFLEDAQKSDELTRKLREDPP